MRSFIRGTKRLRCWLGTGLFCVMTLRGLALQRVTLAWDRNTEANIAGYKLYYGTAARTYPNVVNVGNVTNRSVSNLVDGVRYYFAVTAYNTLGVESDFSIELAYTAPTNVPPTLNPLPNLTINEDAGTQIVPLSGISAGSSNQTPTLTVTAISSNVGLIPAPIVNYSSPNVSGTLSFKPATN